MSGTASLDSGAAELRLVSAAERLLNTLEFDPLCGASASDDDVLVSVMPSFQQREAGRFDAVVTCASRRGMPAAWTTLRVCPLPKGSSFLGAIGPGVNRLGQAILSGLEREAYVLKAYRRAGTFQVQERLAEAGWQPAAGSLGSDKDDTSTQTPWTELPSATLGDERVTTRCSVRGDQVEIVFVSEDQALAGTTVEFCVLQKDTGEVLYASKARFSPSEARTCSTKPTQVALDPGQDFELMYRLVKPE